MLLKLLGYFLALRIITQRPLKYFLENKEAFSELNNIDESNITEILDNDYSAMISMITHEKDAPDSLAMKNAVISVFFLRFLQHGKYFTRYVPEKKRGDRSLHPAETLILNILHHLIGSIQHNSSLFIKNTAIMYLFRYLKLWACKLNVPQRFNASTVGQ